MYENFSLRQKNWKIFHIWKWTVGGLKQWVYKNKKHPIKVALWINKIGKHSRENLVVMEARSTFLSALVFLVNDLGWCFRVTNWNVNLELIVYVTLNVNGWKKKQLHRWELISVIEFVCTNARTLICKLYILLRSSSRCSQQLQHWVPWWLYVQTCLLFTWNSHWKLRDAAE